MVVAEISIIPIGTETTSVSRYVSAAVKEIEASGLKCSLGPMGTTIEAESIDEIYAAIARAQAAVFDLGAGRTYTILKIRRASGRGRPLDGGHGTLRRGRPPRPIGSVSSPDPSRGNALWPAGG